MDSFQTIIKKINTESEREMLLEGKIIKWNNSAGYGWIERLDGGLPNVFVHSQQLATGGDSLPVGTRVKFNMATNLRNQKLHAVDVTPI
jgi:cold shock CspA family protein